jgi:hypothetical protein
MRDNLDAALAYANYGYAVFPIHSPMNGKKCDCFLGDACTSPSKHPRTQHGLADATTDAGTVKRWWTTWGHANIGIATGPGSGLVVLDIDPRHGGDAEMLRLVTENELLPPGPAYQTGSGGDHYWFRHPGFKITSRNSVAPGVDVKGDGGYVIVPPSVHSTGGSYEWHEGCAVNDPCPEIPAWLMTLMQHGDSGHGHAQEIPADVMVERNNTLTSLGGTLRRRGLAEGAIFKLLMALNETWSNPLDAREVAQVAASVSRYEPVPEGEVIIDTAPIQRARKNGHVPNPNPYEPNPYSAVELMGRDLADVRMVIDTILPEGLAILAGKPKLGKSFMSFNMGIALAQGGIVMGEIGVDEGEVLILALEDNERRLKKRLAGLLGDEPAPCRLFFETRWPREDEGGGNLLDSWLGLHPDCKFVVIDTLAKFRPKGVEGKYSEDYASIEGLQELAGKHGVCILLITHYRKAFSDDWLDNVTGTLGIAGAADTILGLERPRGGVGQASAILHVTGRDVEERDFALKMDGLTGQWMILGDADEYQMGVETTKLIGVLRENGAPMKINEIATRLGKKRNTVSHLCSRAASEGLIKGLGGGLYSVLGE